MKTNGPIIKDGEQEIEIYYIPSENYLLKQREILFRDEWLFYLVLGVLFFTQNYFAMIYVVPFGIILILVSYYRQWKMEDKRFRNE